MATDRWKHISIALAIALLAASISSIYIINFMNSELNRVKEEYGRLQTEYSSLRDQLCQAYFPSNLVYRQAGYPKIAYSSGIQYSPSLPNYTVFIRTLQAPGIYFKLGTLQAPVIDLNTAIRLATSTANLDPSRYNLVSADFEPGAVINQTLYDRPQWSLYFARVYGGFWLYGPYAAGNSVCSLVVSVDALNGTVKSTGLEEDDPHLPTSGEHFELKVDAAEALQAVRVSDLKGVPKTLTENGTVKILEPRIILLGPGSRSLFFEDPLDTSLSGKRRLCWIIGLYSPVPEYGYFGIFAVDAETGVLISGYAQAYLPQLHYYTVDCAIVSSSTHNITVSNQTLPVDGGMVGRNGAVKLAVPEVVVVRPGASGSITLKITSNHPQDVNVNLTLVNPLPAIQNLDIGGSQPRLSIRFERHQVSVPGNGSSEATLLISTLDNTPQKTYLVEVDFSYIYPSWNQPARGSFLFLLTVWDGEGSWPPPPIMREASS